MEARLLKKLRENAAKYGCSYYLATLDTLHMIDLLNNFAFERMVSKAQRIIDVYESDGAYNWNQTLYLYFLRSLGLPSNSEVYMELARRVSYANMLKERYDPESLEALMIGASGLLDNEKKSDYYLYGIRSKASYLLRKYDIEPMAASAWAGVGRSANHPMLRLSQATTLFVKHGMLHDAVLDCKCSADIEELFMVAASEYWDTHYVPLRTSARRVKRIGSDLANIIGINLVAPYKFAYGRATDDADMVSDAFQSWENMPAEVNRYTNGWKSSGLRPVNGYESQALIELYTKYCAEGRCESCPVAKSQELDGGAPKRPCL